MIAWLAAAVLGAPLDPLLTDLGLPPEADVTLVRGAERWTVNVRGRSFTVAVPRTPADEQALQVLVLSLWTDLDLLPLSRLPAPPPMPPPPEAPAPRPQRPPVPELPPEPPLVVIVPLPAPAPAPVVDEALPEEPIAVLPAPAPAPPEPPRVRVWAGADLVVRDRLWPAVGGAVAVLSGVRGGLGARVGGRLPRTTAWGAETRLTEVTADLLLWTRPAPPVVLVAGLGVAGRWYAADEETVASHAVPRATVGVTFPVDAGAVALAIGGGMECDLFATSVGFPDALDLLSPLAARIEIGVGFEPVRGIPTSY